MPDKDKNILKYNHGEESLKVLFIIYAEMEPLLEKNSTCHNNPNKLSTTKVNKHTPTDYSLFIHCSFDVTKNSLDYYRVQDYMKNFSNDLKEHATKIISYEKKINV